jgi:hypothetical protein
MATRVTVERDHDGRLVVCKSALPGDTGDRAAEAEWLRRAAGPGVVALAPDQPATADRLVTLHAGGRTWRTVRPDPPQAAPLVAATLRTVAELHRRGLVHGNLDADHILVTGPATTVVCSPRPGLDDPAVDRRALATLVGDERRRWAAGNRRVPDDHRWQRVADLLVHPTAGWALDDIAALLDTPTGPSPSPARLPGRRLVLGAAATVVVLALAVVAARSSGDAGPHRLHPASGPALELGSSRYRLAGPGDRLAATASPCPGSPPAAALDAEGVVWAFTDLPRAGAPQVGRPVQLAPGADEVAVVAEGACGRIVVRGPAGEAPVAPVRPGGAG